MISFFERQTTNVKGATLALEVIVAPLAHRNRNLSIPMDGDSDELATLLSVMMSTFAFVLGVAHVVTCR